MSKKVVCCICLTACSEFPCKNCKLSVHKSCLINKGDECTCSSELVFCVVCPIEHGAFNRVSGDLDSFIHVLCAQWIPSVEIRGDLVDISEIPFESWSGTCSICHSNYGVVMNCAAHGCKNLQHITCAHNLGFLEKDPSLEKNLGNFIFCERHATKEAKKNAFVRSIEKNKMQQVLRPSDTDPRQYIHAQLNTWLAAQNSVIKQAHHDHHKRISEFNSLKSQIPVLMHNYANAQAELAAQRSHSALLTNAHSEISRNTVRVSSLFHPLPPGTDILEHFCKGDGIQLDSRYNNFFSNVYERHDRNTRTHEYASFLTLVEELQGRKAVLCDVCKRLNGNLDDDAARFVECDNCEHVFHLGCLDPPMLKCRFL